MGWCGVEGCTAAAAGGGKQPAKWRLDRRMRQADASLHSSQTKLTRLGAR